MTTYAIGDLQGCHDQLMELVARLDAIEPQCRLVFVGDIVNRGPKSLETLRKVRAFGDRAQIVLGNHDLNLLAVAAGLRKPHRSDTIDDILTADDRDELLGWLRRQPLALYEDKHLFVHAGVLPQWTVEQTLALAEEVHAALQGPYWVEFLKDMYGNEPAKWHDDLQGADRLRCIVNALTRLRYCDAEGRMDFKSKEGFIEGAAPDGLMPWFNVPSRRSANVPVVFGHWSTLGLIVLPNLVSLDTGCVWGGKLTAVNLHDHTVVQIDCPQQQAPNE